MNAPKFEELTEITDAEFQAFDPQIQRSITMRNFDKVNLARMRDAVNDDAYAAMSQGYFGGEKIDANNNAIYNFSRELGRGLTRTVIDAPGATMAMMTAGLKEDEVAHMENALSDRVLQKLGIDNDPEKIQKLKSVFENNITDLTNERDEYLKWLDKNEKRLTRWFGENRNTFVGDIGGAVGNVMAMVGMSALGGPMGATATAAIMGAESGASILQEGLDAGLSDDEAYNRAMGYAITEGILERAGIGLMWNAAGKSLVRKAIRGFVVEASEEGSQQLAEDLIMRDVRGKTAMDILTDVAYSALIGGIAGAPGGMLEGGAAISTRLRRQYVDELKERGISEKDANKMIDAVAEISRNKDEVSQTFDAVLSDQLDMGQYPNGNYADAQKVWASIAQDAVAAARADVDIRQAVKDRTQGVDERTQNIVADSMQAFADRAADDFGITQREVLERTGLRINAENAPRTFDDGSRINENGEFVDANGNVLFQSAMYRNKRTDIKEFTQFVLDNPNNKKSYQTFITKNGISVDLPSDTIIHDDNRHQLTPQEWQEAISALNNIKVISNSARGGVYGTDSVLLRGETDNGKSYAFAIDILPGRNMITTAFSDNANTIDSWIKEKARRPQSAAANSAQAVEFYPSGQQAFDDIINRIRSNVKDTPDGKVYHQDGKLDIRGYFDWSNKMQQIIQIMKTGDLDTVLHELGHFFSVNYINMAIESGKLDNVRPLMDYYKVANPQELIYNEEIQEDLAVKFLSYIKTDQSPRGFRKYFDAAKDWLIATWDKLRNMGMVTDDDLPDEIVRFFDTITIARPRNLNLDTVADNKARLKKILRDARRGKLEQVSDADLRQLEELIKAATARIPRMPRSLYSKLWGSLNRRFAETHDLAPLMGVDDRAFNLMTRKDGGISNENDLIDYLIEDGFLAASHDFNDVNAEQELWDNAMRLVANAKNTYSLDDAAKIEEINQLRQAKEDALDILDGMDAYDALATVQAAKSAAAVAEDNVARTRGNIDELKKDYRRVQNQLHRARQQNSEYQNAVRSAINFLFAQDLPSDVKARFMRKINSVHDTRSLGKWMQDVRERAFRTYSDQMMRAQRERVNKELKETYTRNKNNMKYDYEHNKLFNDLRRYNHMSANDAIAEIQQFYTDTENPVPLSRADELRKMMLNYRINGARGCTAEFMDDLIGRIQEAKLIGRDAADEIQFERGINRVQIQDDILDAIDKNKKHNALERGYVRVLGNLKSTLTAITNSEIAERFDMVGKEIQSTIDGRKRVNDTLNEIMRINNIHGRSELLAYKNDLIKPIDGLRVWYVDHSGKKVYYMEQGKDSFSRGQIMNMWNQYKDKDSHELMDQFYGEGQIRELFGYLTEADKQTADYMMERLGDIYDMVNPYYVQVYQKDMPHRANYWPRQSNHETVHDLMDNFDGGRTEPNFIKSRSHGAVPVFYKDALTIYTGHELDAQYMIHEAVSYKELADVFRNSTVQAAIRNKFGKKTLEQLNEHIKAVSIGGVRKNRNAVTDALTKIIGQWTVAKIAINPMVLGGQMSAFHAYSNNMPTATYYKDFVWAMAHPRQSHAYMKKYVGDYLENRVHGGFNETLKNMIDYEKTAAWRADLNTFLTTFVRWGDYASLVWGGYPRLKYLMNERDENGNLLRDEATAVRQWITESEESMQSSTQASLSQMQRQGGWNSLFTTFKNQQSQYVRKIFDAWFELGRGEITVGKFAKTVANYLVVQSMLFAIMRYTVKLALGLTGDNDDVTDDIMDAILMGAIDPFPIVGDIGNLVYQKLTDGNTYGRGIQLVAVDDALRAITGALQLATSEKSRRKADWHDYVNVMAPFVEMTTSLPIAQYNRYLEKWGL